ncbi:MAG TPA: glycosyltransferase [Myxococcaceae bacterium]|jgi:glycosyltransferase involved in cell wall biosynthesis|nr:glycosyltransferase [Myxococcaceae bacterium]
MRVLHLLSSPVFSGAAEGVALLALGQRRAGAGVSVAVDRTRAGTGSEEPAVPRLDTLGLLDDLGLGLSTRSGPLRMLVDARRLRRAPLDVVHCHGSHDHWLGWLGRPRGARLVRSLHAPRSLRWSMPAADAMTVPFPDLVPGLPPGPAMILPALVDTAAFHPRSEREELRRALGLPPGPVVGMASTFQASRRHALALAAFAALLRRAPEATLVLLGDGILLSAVRERARVLGLTERVRFPGYRGGAELVPWLQALDELWVLGLGNDWAGRTALQARACGVRVVAVRLGALPFWADVVLDEPTAEALAAAALGPERRWVPLPDLDRVAHEVLALYRSAGARG